MSEKLSLLIVMQTLYKDEINVSISCFWDGGWDVKLGDEMNGFVAEDNINRIEDVAQWLANQAKKHFPKSETAGLG